MRNVIWLVLLFAVAVVAALTLGDNSGLASFYWSGWRLDLSLNFFLIAAIAIGFAVLTTTQAISSLVGLPARAREWRGLRLERAAQAALREALGEYFGGPLTAAPTRPRCVLWPCAEQVEQLRGDHELRMLAHLLAAGACTGCRTARAATRCCSRRCAGAAAAPPRRSTTVPGCWRPNGRSTIATARARRPCWPSCSPAQRGAPRHCA